MSSETNKEHIKNNRNNIGDFGKKKIKGYKVVKRTEKGWVIQPIPK